MTKYLRGFYLCKRKNAILENSSETVTKTYKAKTYKTYSLPTTGSLASLITEYFFYKSPVTPASS